MREDVLRRLSSLEVRSRGRRKAEWSGLHQNLRKDDD